MSREWALDLAFPFMARLPTTVPWRLASVLGRESRAERGQLIPWLEGLFARVFPSAGKDLQREWARNHLAMLAQEMVDAMAFDRLGRSGGPAVELAGQELVQDLLGQGQGFILVLNHYDRLLTAPVALARAGIVTDVLTMPVWWYDRLPNHPQ